VGQPAAVMGDRITGTCAIHQIPNPSSGAPQPSGPLPFSSPLLQALCTRVMIGGKPAATAGSSGTNTPPHIGLHPSDPFLVPTNQVGNVVAGSNSVFFEGKPAARTGASCTMCGGAPGQLVGSAATVLIGG
jgi:uncharacterized Zn-binding protein involved in type VI secretion